MTSIRQVARPCTPPAHVVTSVPPAPRKANKYRTIVYPRVRRNLMASFDAVANPK